MQSLKNFVNSDKSRYITAGVLIIIVAALFIINFKPLIWAVLGILMLVGIYESFQLYGLETKIHFYICAAAGWILAYFITEPILSALLALACYASYIAYTKKLELKNLAPLIYPLLPFLCIWSVYAQFDRLGLICLIVVVAGTDTFAYFGGKLFGKTPFCPTSPKKTLEGVVIGVLCGTILGAFLFIGLTHEFKAALILSALTSISAVFGDLFESYLKRQADVKDSGTIFPGHGGVLDRLDALFFASIAMLVCMSFINALAI